MRAKITEHQQTNKTIPNIKNHVHRPWFSYDDFRDLFLQTNNKYRIYFFLRFYILSVHSSIKVETELYIFLTILIKHKNDNTYFQLRYNVTSLG